jgi:hypothetical protein
MLDFNARFGYVYAREPHAEIELITQQRNPRHGLGVTSAKIQSTHSRDLRDILTVPALAAVGT